MMIKMLVYKIIEQPNSKKNMCRTYITKKVEMADDESIVIIFYKLQKTPLWNSRII